MARAYSVDLRSRVIEAALNDGSIRQAAQRFGVGITTATRWVRRWREQGESSARRQGKPRGSCLDPHRDDLLALVEQTRDLTLAEIVAHLRAEHGLNVGTTTVWKFLERQGLTYKKRRHTPPSNNVRT
ncbi:Transposase [Azotobacter beijerinckii]|uniref:Transposase n=1 Tax=Azotobacter beijerinckii TaxID=170623 RepID=A0A1H7AC44_9GAMM|nr:Transposase [Azotobacter beijerinckii]